MSKCSYSYIIYNEYEYIYLIDICYRWGMNSDGTSFEAINHSYEAIAVSQYLANFFVTRCRHNHNKFTQYEDENLALIYNYNITTISKKFSLIYLFEIFY